jgi:uncharacterized protein (DUF1499 family)
MTDTDHVSTDPGPTQLADCPPSPNCVCTQASRVKQAMKPVGFVGSPAEAIARVADLIESLPRTQLVERRPHYVHAVFSSRLLRFKDDVEFLADQATGQLHYRSASRLGYSDLGVNRQRMQRLRQMLIETGYFID